MYISFRTFLLTPIKSSATILNKPTNTFYPTDTAPVLISENYPPLFSPHSLYCLLDFHPAPLTHSVTASSPKWLLIDNDLHEVKTSLQLYSVLLNVPIIYLLISSLFTCKSYPLFIPIFITRLEHNGRGSVSVSFNTRIVVFSVIMTFFSIQ